MKNIDRIKAMNVDEMAEWFAINIRCKGCFIENCDTLLEWECNKIFKQWLLSESEENHTP